MTDVLAIEPLKPFVYEIVNVRSQNHAFLSDDGAVVGHTTMDPDDVITRPLLWMVKRLGNGRYCIQNRMKPERCVCSKGEHILTDTRVYQWIIKKSSSTEAGHLLIESLDDKYLFWGLMEFSLGFPVKLHNVPTNVRNHWEFRPYRQTLARRFRTVFVRTARRVGAGTWESGLLGRDVSLLRTGNSH